MTVLARRLLLFAALLASAARAGDAANGFIALAYHDVRPESNGDPMTTTLDQFKAHLDWLLGSGYRFVGVRALAEARRLQKPLPEKSVLLTFDDAYAGFYDHVLPILKARNIPAVLAVVTGWLETPAGRPVQYDTHTRSRDDFLTWRQIREIAASGLVEIASHSHDLHRGIPGNPYGDLQPAATTRLYSGTDYEPDDLYRQRIKTDLQMSAAAFRRHLGVSPHVLVWPYGEFSRETEELAEQAGFTLFIGLGEGGNTLTDLPRIKRYLVSYNPDAAELARDIARIDQSPPVRVVQIDMDYIYDDDAGQIVRNIGKLLDRIKAMRINTVYLQTFSDPEGDGAPNSVYFASRRLPVRADLFGHVAWQLATRAKVKVYAWMPVLSFPLDEPDAWWVHEFDNGQARLSRHNYRRLSPFFEPARQAVAEIYQELARHAHFSGILFHDDGVLTDQEDANPAAQQILQGLTPDQQRWRKILALTDWTGEMAARVRYFRPAVKTARNLYANAALNPDSSRWFSQSLANFLQSYDYTAVLAMPYMENVDRPLPWLEALVDRIRAFPHGLEKTVFELQAVDWRVPEKVPDAALAEQMALLKRLGALNFGYYPDDFPLEKPDLPMLQRYLSCQPE